MSIQKMFRWGLGALGLLSLAALVVALIALGNYSGQTPGAQAQPTNTPTPAPATTTSAAAPSSNPISVTVANPGPSRQISVYAVGQVQAPPDVAYLNVGVEL